MVTEGCARLTVPTRFLKSWIEAHYADRVLSIYRSEDSQVDGIAIAVRSSVPQERSQRADAPLAPKRARIDARAKLVSERDAVPALPRDERAETELGGAPLDPRLTFASFIVGRSNALAHAAADRVARHGGQALYNPLYLHAGVGLGKTHLLHAIGHEARKHGRRVIYLTADRFMYGFVAALKSQTALAFKERLRGIDLLIIDDVQFIQGKSDPAGVRPHPQRADRLRAGRSWSPRTARRPISKRLDERVRSRLAGGLVVEIGALDEQLRAAILAARVAAVQEAHPGFDVSPAVIAYVARAITANGRDLEGAVNRLLAHATLTGAPITLETAEIAIRDLVRTREPKRVKIEDIQKLVASHYNVSRSDILSERRTAAVVKPRQIAMYLAKVADAALAARDRPPLRRARPHHRPACRAQDREALGEDTALHDEVELLKRMLQE